MGRKADLVGYTFGNLDVLSKLPNTTKVIYWNCRCTCGALKAVTTGNLLSGKTKSCGCLRPTLKTSKLLKKLEETKSNHIIKSLKVLPNSCLFKCSCGVDVTCSYQALRKRKLLSCKDCLNLNNSVRQLTHGLTRTSIYRKWRNLKSRCLNPKVSTYCHYGGRGIKVHEGWVNDFQAFYDYCYLIHPNLDELLVNNFEIDRINNDGNYEPGNIRFVSRSEQEKNKHRVKT